MSFPMLPLIPVVLMSLWRSIAAVWNIAAAVDLPLQLAAAGAAQAPVP
jgi:hypothetical protein